ncbi:MarR family winged helix-turn-helix transcriptional regulator [Mycobacterium sp. WMMD1722]|uniref:MarR family winged helix-turn-helix transcriptional regulator n=1 Tax=Mycobacterium sp. WMMD1722 TaxID=3404117 RepID=UPI003BF4F120
MAALRLDQHLCFALYSATRAMTAAYRPVLTELNLTYPQYLVLLVLWEEGAVTVSRLGERLQLDSGTLSPLLKRLEANGVLQRRRSRTDERQVEVVLTESGRALEERAQCIPEQLFAATGLSVDDAERLRDAVRQLSDALTASAHHRHNRKEST